MGEAAPLVGRAPRYIPEVQGLRTIALVLVATFHIWLGKVSGGVDVFLLISAYLLTRSLTARAEAGERTRPVTFIIRKFARLLPAAALVIALTVIAGFTLLEPRFWAGILGEATAALTYTTNFRLQAEAVDYYAASRSTASLFQHFWSLSIQGQVFILWPLLHLLGEGVARGLRLRVRPVLIILFGGVGIASFAYAIAAVAANPQLAYFDTPARLWEFAAGSLLALIAPYLVLTTRARRVLAWIGVAGVLSCGFVLPVQGTFPGAAALWPVISSGLVIVSAEAMAPRSAPEIRPDPILGSRWLRTAGEYTYALYLVHWPVLILTAMLTGVERPSPIAGLGILALSTLLAIGVTIVADKPAGRLLRADRPLLGSARWRWTPRTGVRTVAVLAISALVGASAIAVGSRALSRGNENAYAELHAADLSRLGPQADPGEQFDHLIPDQSIMADQLFTGPDVPCADDDPHLGPGLCRTWGDPDATHSVLMVGNSHTIVFTGFVMEAAERQEDWFVRTQAAPGCAYDGRADPGSECAELWDAAQGYILEHQPDVVIVLGTMSDAGGPDHRFDREDSSLPTWIAEMREQIGSRFITIRDTPRFPFNAFECASTRGYESDECTTARAPDDPELAEYALQLETAGAIWVDLDEVVCPDLVCRPSQGGLVTYYDSNHLTDVYSRSLAQRFADQLDGRIDWWPTTIWPSAPEEGA